MSASLTLRSNYSVTLYHKSCNVNFSCYNFRDADVNIEGKKEQTPLHLAASQGNPAITKVLLAYGANVRKTDRNL